MRDYGRLNISEVETWLPKGEYYFGDPCYAMNDADWTTVCEVMARIPDIGGPVRVGESVVCIFSTAHGDGVYQSRGAGSYEIGVDSGTIGIVPWALVNADSEHLSLGHKVTFDRDVYCKSDGKMLTFGKYTVDTLV